MKQTLYILTGLPYAGKSTLTKELVRRYAFWVASVDDILDERKMDSDSMSQQDWNGVYSEAYDRLKQKLSEGMNVVFDMGHLKRSERQTAYYIAEKAGVRSKLIYVTTQKDEIWKRWERNAVTKERGQLSRRGLDLAFTLFEEPNSNQNPIIYTQNLNLDKWLKETIED